MKRVAEYIEDQENRRKLTNRLGMLVIVSGVAFILFSVYFIVFLKSRRANAKAAELFRIQRLSVSGCGDRI